MDLKSALTNCEKIETVRMEIWQGFDSLKQVIRILREKKLLGKFEDWRDLMCEDCKYKKKLMEDVIELELEGTIKGGEDRDKEITFSYDDWEDFLDKVKEKPPKKKEKKELPEEYKPHSDVLVDRKKRRIRCKECEELYYKEEGHTCE